MPTPRQEVCSSYLMKSVEAMHMNADPIGTRGQAARMKSAAAVRINADPVGTRGEAARRQRLNRRKTTG